MNGELNKHVSNETSTFSDFLNVVRRRKVIVLLAILIVPSVAVVLSMRKPALYQARAQVLISDQTGSLAASLAGVPVSTLSNDPNYAATQAFLASSPEVAAQVVKAVASSVSGLTAGQFLSESSVGTSANTDLLQFTVVSEDPAVAVVLVNAYATTFTSYSQGLNSLAVQQALTAIENQMRELRATKQVDTTTYQNLVAREQQDQTVEALLKQNAYLARKAGGAAKIQPNPKKDGMLGLFLGVVLGIAFAYLREATDTRIRTIKEIGDRLGLPLLGRLAEPSRRALAGYELELLNDAQSIRAEAYRMLRVNIDLANVDHRARAIMVTSGLEEEGKTTTTVNLAVAMARAGKRVILIDLDLRRPTVERYFGLEDRAGVTNVALGDISLDDALRPAYLGEDAAASDGWLKVLTAGSLPPDPGEWIGNNVLAAIIDELVDRSDLVLVDTPPILHVGDALALSPRMDAILLVVRLSKTRRGGLAELRRLLDTTPVTKLGFVVTDAPASAEGGHTYGSYLPRAYEPEESPGLVR